MKKLSKRFLTLAIACVMAMAMAVPAFADWTIEVDDNSNRYINVYGTYGSSLNMRYLTLYKTSAPNSEQRSIYTVRAASGTILFCVLLQTLSTQ